MLLSNLRGKRAGIGIELFVNKLLKEIDTGCAAGGLSDILGPHSPILSSIGLTPG